MFLRSAKETQISLRKWKRLLTLKPMKAIARFSLLLLLICGTALAWKSSEHRFRRFVPQSDEGRQREESDMMQDALQPLGSARMMGKIAPTWTKGEFQSKLEEAFQRVEPCAVLELLHSTNGASPREYWSAGMAVLVSQARERVPLLEELLARQTSPIYGMPLVDSKSKETRFLNALLYSGQLRASDDGESTPKHLGNRNLDKAVEILKQLIQEDPDNGAYSYFLASTLKQMGANKDEVRAAFQQASKAPRFDPFYQSIFDDLQHIAYANAATFAWAHAFLESMPLPDYEIGIRYLKYWAHDEENGKWVALRLAKRFLDIGASYKSGSPGYQFSHSEYVLGQHLKLAVEGKMEKSWEEYATKMREAQSFISDAPKEVKEAEVNIYGEKIGEKQGCVPDSWKMLFQASRAKKDSKETN